MSFRVLFSLTLLCSAALGENLHWNLGLTTWLGRGDQNGQTYDYTENYLSLNADRGALSGRMELEYSDPPEFGYSLQGLRRIWLQYYGEHLVLEAGDIGAVFGRGLALNLYEDQAIDFDNIPRGIRLNLTLGDALQIDALAGVKEDYRFYSPSSPQREPDGENDFKLAGVQVTGSGSNGMFSSSPYLVASELASDFRWTTLDPSSVSLVTQTVSQTMRSLQAGWAQAIYGGNWDLFVDATLLEKGLDYPSVDTEQEQLDDGAYLRILDSRDRISGNGLYAQFNWFPEWFTAMVEYHRYAFGREGSADKGNPYLQATKPLPWQLGPTTIRQHDISLLANVTHPIDYGDDVGLTLELKRYFGFAWALTLNGSFTSQLDRLGQSDGEGLYLPSSQVDHNPWQEVYAELEYTSNSLTNRSFLARTGSVISFEEYAEVKTHVTIVPAYLNWHPTDQVSLSTVFEWQQSSFRVEHYPTDGGVLNPDPGYDYFSSHLILSADLLHRYSASFIWDASDDPGLSTDDGAGTQNWLSYEISVKPRDDLWLRASYGDEKGGVRCTGGVCRVLQPFSGFRMSLEWRL